MMSTSPASSFRLVGFCQGTGVRGLAIGVAVTNCTICSPPCSLNAAAIRPESSISGMPGFAWVTAASMARSVSRAASVSHSISSSLLIQPQVPESGAHVLPLRLGEACRQIFHVLEGKQNLEAGVMPTRPMRAFPSSRASS